MNIKCLNKAAILATLYNRAQAQGMGLLINSRVLCMLLM